MMYTAAKDIAAEAELEPRHVADSQRVTGIYRRRDMLASGRYVYARRPQGVQLGTMEAGHRTTTRHVDFCAGT